MPNQPTSGNNPQTRQQQGYRPGSQQDEHARERDARNKGEACDSRERVGGQQRPGSTDDDARRRDAEARERRPGMTDDERAMETGSRETAQREYDRERERERERSAAGGSTGRNPPRKI